MKWRQFAKRLLLADGRVDAAEAAVVRRAVTEDGVVDQDEVEFLLELKREAVSVHPDFTAFLYRIIKKSVVKDGAVSKAEAAWLRKLVFATNLAGPQEVGLLEEIAREVRRASPEFHSLLVDAGVTRAAGG